MDQWKKVTWFDEYHFLFDHVDRQVCARRLLWPTFFWETLGQAIHVGVTLTRHLSTLLQTTSTYSRQQHSPMAVPSVSRIIHPATLLELFKNGFWRRVQGAALTATIPRPQPYQGSFCAGTASPIGSATLQFGGLIGSAADSNKYRKTPSEVLLYPCYGGLRVVLVAHAGPTAY